MSFSELEYSVIVVCIVIGCFLALAFVGVFSDFDVEGGKIQLLQKRSEQESFKYLTNKGYKNLKFISVEGTDKWFHLVFETELTQIKITICYFETYNSWVVNNYEEVPI